MRRLGLPLVMALAAWLWLSAGALAGTPEVTDFSVEAADHLTVGDRVRYSVSVNVTNGTTLSLAADSLPPELALVAPPVIESRNAGAGTVTLTLTFEVAVFQTGRVAVPPITLAFKGPAGEGLLQTPASSLSVASVLSPGSAATPRDLKPQAEVGSPPAASWPYFAGAALLLLAAAACQIQRRRRRRPLPVMAPLELVLSPEDRARGALDEIATNPSSPAEYMAYYSRIAEVVRVYLTERFDFPAFALTTRELQEAMIHNQLDRWQARVVSGLLSQCDFVVYAHYRPAPERADADLTAAYEIVEISRPRVLEEALAT